MIVSLFFLAVEDENRPRPQVTRFISGDDLEDDFLMDDTSDKKHKLSASAADPSEVKPKKKGPKVINFVG